MTPPGSDEPPLASDLVGLEVGPVAHAIDARWLMAYAAALGETAPRYFDTRRADGPAAHPVFPVSYEWPVALALHARLAPEALQRRSVHAAHDLTIHRPLRAGDALQTRARVMAVRKRRAGALVVVRYDTVDGDGRPVTTTFYGSIYRGVTVDGPDRGEVPWAADPAPAAALAPLGAVDVPVTLAHVYTECARIWNPIHTDAAVAEAAGFPGVILHGTATLALAVSRVLAADDGDPTRVRRVTCRFTGMVRVPSTFTVRARPAAGTPIIPFDAVGADGGLVLAGGALDRERP
jgi:acyl dehydratase